MMIMMMATNSLVIDTVCSGENPEKRKKEKKKKKKKKKKRKKRKKEKEGTH